MPEQPPPADHGNGVALRVPSAKHVLAASIVIASVAWTATDWNGLNGATAQLGNVAALAVLIGLSEVCFVAGAVLIATGIGGTLGRKGDGVVSRIAGARRARPDLGLIAAQVEANRLVRVGFYLNLAGALGTAVFVGVGVLVFLPRTAWGLALLALFDVIATFGARAPVLVRWRRSATK